MAGLATGDGVIECPVVRGLEEKRLRNRVVLQMSGHVFPIFPKAMHDQGIIAALKVWYKSSLLARLVETDEDISRLQSLAQQLPAGSAGLKYGAPPHFITADLRGAATLPQNNQTLGLVGSGSPLHSKECGDHSSSVLSSDHGRSGGPRDSECPPKDPVVVDAPGGVTIRLALPLQMRSSSSHAGNADPADAGLRPSSTPACIRKRRNTRRTVDAGQPRVPAFQHQQGIRPQDADDGYRHRRGVKRRRAHHMDSSSRSGDETLVGQATKRTRDSRSEKRRVVDLATWLEAWNIFLAVHLQAVAREKSHLTPWGQVKDDTLLWCATRHPFRAPSSLVPTPCNPLPPMEQPSLPKGVSPTHSQGRKSAGNSITAPAIVPSVPLPTSAGSRVALVTTLASPALELLQLQVLRPSTTSTNLFWLAQQVNNSVLPLFNQTSQRKKLMEGLRHDHTLGTHDQLMLRAVMALAVFGFLRVGEFTTSTQRPPTQFLARRDISLSRDQMKVFLHFFQNRPVGERKYDYHRARLEVSVAQFIFGPLQSIRV
eukprot:Em0001g2227a